MKKLILYHGDHTGKDPVENANSCSCGESKQGASSFVNPTHLLGSDDKHRRARCFRPLKKQLLHGDQPLQSVFNESSQLIRLHGSDSEESPAHVPESESTLKEVPTIKLAFSPRQLRVRVRTPVSPHELLQSDQPFQDDQTGVGRIRFCGFPLSHSTRLHAFSSCACPWHSSGLPNMHIRRRVCIPFCPQLWVQLDQLDQESQLGHGSVLHASLCSKAALLHSAPSQFRVRVPPPQVVVQLDHELQVCDDGGQDWLLQACSCWRSPSHPDPTQSLVLC